jgi:hypothetical protein
MVQVKASTHVNGAPWAQTVPMSRSDSAGKAWSRAGQLRKKTRWAFGLLG